jgi:hypothetical protein
LVLVEHLLLVVMELQLYLIMVFKVVLQLMVHLLQVEEDMVLHPIKPLLLEALVLVAVVLVQELEVLVEYLIMEFLEQLVEQAV